MSRSFAAMQMFVLDYIDNKIPLDDQYYENKRLLPQEARKCIPKEHQGRHRMSLLRPIARMLLGFEQCHPDWVRQDKAKLKQSWKNFITSKQGMVLLHEHFPTEQTASGPVLKRSVSFISVVRRGTGDHGEGYRRKWPLTGAHERTGLEMIRRFTHTITGRRNDRQR
ncbi:hypothetical protein BDW75DRAFT_196981 [Aspergillus navahoensis]